jgi:hypothetical protein
MKKNKWWILALLATGCGHVYSPLSPNSASVTPSVAGSGLIDDFESRTAINDLGGTNAVFTDTIQPTSSTMTQSYVPGSTLSGGSPNFAVRFTGVELQNSPFPGAGAAGGYPYCVYQMNIAFLGKDISAMAPNHRLSFAIKVSPTDLHPLLPVFPPAPPNNYRVTITNYPITDYDWYTYQFPATAAMVNNWTKITVNFPTYGLPAPLFAQLYGPPIPTVVPWPDVQAHVTTVTFAPFSYPTHSMTYDFCIDDVRFE